MASVESLGWTEALAAEEAEVRERWCGLRGILLAIQDGPKNPPAIGKRTSKTCSHPDRALWTKLTSNLL